MATYQRCINVWFNVSIDADTPEDAAAQLAKLDPCTELEMLIQVNPERYSIDVEGTYATDYFQDLDTGVGDHVNTKYIDVPTVLEAITREA